MSELGRVSDLSRSFMSSVTHGGLVAPIRRLRRLPYALLPSFARQQFYNEDISLPHVSSTTWMDGLRGWAALIVFNYHFFFAFTDGTTTGYGYDSKHTSIFELPFLHLLYDGATCVNIFFVVAGYVCSAKPLHLMTTDRLDILAQTMAGSVFRRFFRLYLPVLCTSFLSAMAACSGLFDILRPMMDKRNMYFPGSKFSEIQLRQSPNLRSQLSFWAREMYGLGMVFREAPFYPEHDPHLWTIQYEFRTSMHLYIVLLGLTRCRPLVRIGWLCVLSVIYLFWNRWEGPLFFLGAAIAQYDVLRQIAVETPPQHEHDSAGTAEKQTHKNQVQQSQLSGSWRILRLLGYAAALYLMSYPISNYKRPAPGFEWMNGFIPKFYTRKEKFPKSIGVLLLFYLLTTSPRHSLSPQLGLWHRFLTCGPARYLAMNMFALYLVHGPVLHIVGYGLPHFFWRVFPKETTFGYLLGLTLGWVLALLICISVADVFHREVNTRCSRLVKWLEQKCFVKT